MERVGEMLRELGAWVTGTMWRLGFAARFFLPHTEGVGSELSALSPHHPRNLLRRGTVPDHHPRLGTVRRHGARAAGLRHAGALRIVGGARACWWRCRWCASSGPVVAALLFASRAGSAITAEIGLMKATEQTRRDGNDGGRPDRARRRAALLGRGDFDAAARGAVFRDGDVRRLPGRRAADRRRRRLVLVADAGGGGFPRGRRERRHQERRVRRRRSPGSRCSRATTRRPTAEGVSRATTRTVVTSSLAVLALDFVLTALMFRGI